MSDFNRLISNLVVQDETRKRFLEDPDSVMADYSLSSEEVSQLKAIDMKELTTEMTELESRLSKSFVSFWNLDVDNIGPSEMAHSSHSAYGGCSGCGGW